MAFCTRSAACCDCSATHLDKERHAARLAHRNDIGVLETLGALLGEQDLGAVGGAMKSANAKINALPPIAQLGQSISARLLDMVGQAQAMDTELAATPDDPLRIIRNMRFRRG